MKAFVVILLVMVTEALTSPMDLSKREELDPVTRLQQRDERLKRWCTYCKIRYEIIAEILGEHHNGYLYRDALGHPLSDYGVIIGCGINLGYITRAYLLDTLFLPDSIITKLTPYLGLKGTYAADKLAREPLVLTDDEAYRLDNLYLSDVTDNVERIYNNAVEHQGHVLRLFTQLTCEVRSVITSLFIRYHNLPTSQPELWDDLVHHLWGNAIDVLNNFHDIFLSQRSREIHFLRIIGNLHCYCTGWAYFCHDPHIATFDGRHFDYQGVCSYILFTDGCGQRRGTFSVESTTEAAGKHVSKVSALTVRITDQSYPIIINLNKNDITLLNGKQLTSFPYHVNTDTVIDKTVNNDTRVSVYGKFTVTWGGDGRIQTSLDKELFGQVCGLLGDADGDKMNDFLMPNGTLTKSLDEFGKSWEVPGSEC